MLLTHLLCLVCAVKDVAGERTLRACHISSNDEVCGAEILTYYHVLDRFARASHFHRVRQIRPTERIAHPPLVSLLLLHNLVGLDACRTIDVSWLCRSAGWVHEDHRVLNILHGMNKQLEVGFVNWVPVLESNYLLSR